MTSQVNQIWLSREFHWKLNKKYVKQGNLLEKIEYKDQSVIEKTLSNISQKNNENETTFLGHLQWNSHEYQGLLTLHVNASFT